MLVFGAYHVYERLESIIIELYQYRVASKKTKSFARCGKKQLQFCSHSTETIDIVRCNYNYFFQHCKSIQIQRINWLVQKAIVKSIKLIGCNRTLKNDCNSNRYRLTNFIRIAWIVSVFRRYSIDIDLQRYVVHVQTLHLYDMNGTVQFV